MIRFLNDLKNAFRAHFNAVAFIGKNGLWGYFALPVLLNAAFFAAGFFIAAGLAEAIVEAAGEYAFPPLREDSSVLSDVMFVTLFIVIRVFIFLLFSYIGGHLVIFIMAPLLSMLAAKTMKITSSTPPRKVHLLRSWVRSASIALRNLILQILFALLFFAAGFIPFIGAAAPILLLLVSGYFFGFGFVDLYAERTGLSQRASREYLNDRPGVLVGTGLPFALLLAIPVIGQAAAGFAAVTSTVAGVLALRDAETPADRLTSD